VFEVARLSGGQPLEAVSLAALERLGLMDGLSIPRDKMRRYVRVGGACCLGGGGADCCYPFCLRCRVGPGSAGVLPTRPRVSRRIRSMFV
jgi:hypothetical protein